MATPGHIQPKLPDTFSGTVVDVGGGSGNFGTILAPIQPCGMCSSNSRKWSATPSATCRPPMWPTVASSSGADFLETVPEGGNVSIVAHCIHKRDDENC